MLKKKNIYVISVSVLIIFLVILSSFLGLIIYLQWRQLNLAHRYYEALEELDTISYAKNIEIDSPNIKLGFQKLGIVEGKIRNKGKRTIVSIALKVKFLDSLDNPVYSCIIYPLEPFHPPRFFKKIHFTQLIFLKGPLVEPNRVVVFKYPLWHCPGKFVKMLKNGSFSNRPGEWCGKISTEVSRVRLKPTG